MKAHFDGLAGDTARANARLYAAAGRGAAIGHTRAPLTQTLASAQLITHQTHHRGQCHALLTRLTGTAPGLDLVTYQRGSDVL